MWPVLPGAADAASDREDAFPFGLSEASAGASGGNVDGSSGSAGSGAALDADGVSAALPTACGSSPAASSSLGIPIGGSRGPSRQPSPSSVKGGNASPRWLRSGGADGSQASQSGFRHLLSALWAEHERELASLRESNEVLLRKVNDLRGKSEAAAASGAGVGALGAGASGGGTPSAPCEAGLVLMPAAPEAERPTTSSRPTGGAVRVTLPDLPQAQAQAQLQLMHCQHCGGSSMLHAPSSPVRSNRRATSLVGGKPLRNPLRTMSEERSREKMNELLQGASSRLSAQEATAPGCVLSRTYPAISDCFTLSLQPPLHPASTAAAHQPQLPLSPSKIIALSTPLPGGGRKAPGGGTSPAPDSPLEASEAWGTPSEVLTPSHVSRPRRQSKGRHNMKPATADGQETPDDDPPSPMPQSPKGMSSRAQRVSVISNDTEISAGAWSAQETIPSTRSAGENSCDSAFELEESEVMHKSESFCGKDGLTWSIWREVPHTDFKSAVNEDVKRSASVRRSGSGTPRRSSMSEDLEKLEAFGKMSACEAVLGRFIMRPGSKPRTVWDVATLLFIFYDLITLPLQAFDLEKSSFANALDLGIAIFWTLDIAASFSVGYYRNGIVVMQPRSIARNYARGWLGIDSLLVIFAWMQISAESGVENSSTNYARTLRFLRLFRIVRMLKTQSFVQSLVDRIPSESMVIFLGVFKLIFIISIITHFCACGWYGLALLVEDGEQATWISANNMHGQEFSYRYTTALHWSLTQFTPASMEIFPENVYERTFNVIVVLFALVAFSSFISGITKAMDQMARINNEQSEQYSCLRRYLHENKISTELVFRVWNYLNSQERRGSRRIHKQDVKVLQHLSKSLRTELFWEAYSCLLQQHPLFQRIATDTPLLGQMVSNVAQELSMSCGQELYAAGEQAGQTCFTRTGLLSYSIFEDPDRPVAENSWICEAALWMPWTHRGCLTATTRCELVAIQVKDFHTVMRPFLSHTRQVARYAHLFVERAGHLPAEKRRVYLDTSMPYGDLEDLSDNAFPEPSELSSESEEVVQQTQLPPQRMGSFNRRPSLCLLLGGQTPTEG
eukprot:TRINITY_DN22473_c0_g4_i1.p1 TRINITY_DN22473_c0_g4~~TRINITY_DN22473_c0_g4_i1.p1  ORF type:complete len:1074 (+),score=232.13 TRINITY_DN22473_c0_g4_i1:111-3332(+)